MDELKQQMKRDRVIWQIKKSASAIQYHKNMMNVLILQKAAIDRAIDKRQMLIEEANKKIAAAREYLEPPY